MLSSGLRGWLAGVNLMITPHNAGQGGENGCPVGAGSQEMENHQKLAEIR